MPIKNTSAVARRRRETATGRAALFASFTRGEREGPRGQTSMATSGDSNPIRVEAAVSGRKGPSALPGPGLQDADLVAERVAQPAVDPVGVVGRLLHEL